MSFAPNVIRKLSKEKCYLRIPRTSFPPSPSSWCHKSVSSSRPCCQTHFWRFLQFFETFPGHSESANKIGDWCLCDMVRRTGWLAVGWWVLKQKVSEIDNSMINILSCNQAEEHSTRYGVCAILLRLYTSTKHLKKNVYKPTDNFWINLFKRKYELTTFLQLLYLRIVSYT